MRKNPEKNNLSPELCLKAQNPSRITSQVSGDFFSASLECCTGSIPVSRSFPSSKLTKQSGFLLTLQGSLPEQGIFLSESKGSDFPCGQLHPKDCSRSLKSIHSLYEQRSLCSLKAENTTRHSVSLRTKIGWLMLLAVGMIQMFSSTATAAPTVGSASFYSSECCRFNKSPSCPMADGTSLYTAEAQGVIYAAIWNVPFGTSLKVTNLSNNKSVVVVVKDRGPAKRLNRSIDLSKAAFAQIADLKSGLIKVKIEEVSNV